MEPSTQNPAPRSGACPHCLAKHLLKARGYAAEIAEDPSREWERDRLLENLLLAEDHAEAIGDADLRRAIRIARLDAEDRTPDAAALQILLDRARNTTPTP